MEYFAVRPTTSITKIQQAYDDTGQPVFAVVNLRNEYEGLIYVQDLDKWPEA